MAAPRAWPILCAALLLAGCASDTTRSDLLSPQPGGGWGRLTGRSAYYADSAFSVRVDPALLYEDTGKGWLYDGPRGDLSFEFIVTNRGDSLIIDPRKIVFAEPCGPGVYRHGDGTPRFSLSPQVPIMWGEPDYVLPEFPHVMTHGEHLEFFVHLQGNGLYLTQCVLDLSGMILAPAGTPVPRLNLTRETMIFKNKP